MSDNSSQPNNSQEAPQAPTPAPAAASASASATAAAAKKTLNATASEWKPSVSAAAFVPKAPIAATQAAGTSAPSAPGPAPGPTNPAAPVNPNFNFNAQAQSFHYYNTNQPGGGVGGAPQQVPYGGYMAPPGAPMMHHPQMMMNMGMHPGHHHPQMMYMPIPGGGVVPQMMAPMQAGMMVPGYGPYMQQPPPMQQQQYQNRPRSNSKSMQNPNINNNNSTSTTAVSSNVSAEPAAAAVDHAPPNAPEVPEEVATTATAVEEATQAVEQLSVVDEAAVNNDNVTTDAAAAIVTTTEQTDEANSNSNNNNNNSGALEEGEIAEVETGNNNSGNMKGFGGKGIRIAAGLSVNNPESVANNGDVSPVATASVAIVSPRNTAGRFDEFHNNSNSNAAAASSSSTPTNNNSGRDFGAADASSYVPLKPLPILGQMVERRDGVRRYDKLMMLSMYQKPNPQVGRRIKDFYGRFARADRAPKGWEAAKRMHDEEIKRIENLIFKKDEKAAEAFFKAVPIDVPEGEAPVVHSDGTPTVVRSSLESILKQATLLMNKLSPTNFEKISGEFLALDIQRDDVLTAVVNMIVDKAQLQQNFCFMYAELCKKIVDSFSGVAASATIAEKPKSHNAEGEEALSPTSSSSVTASSEAATEAASESATKAASENDFGSIFRTRLLERCKADFSVKRSTKLEEIRLMEIPDDEKEMREIKLKQRYTGFMCFVGEIYLKDLVIVRIMHACLEELLHSTDEGDLVCLVKLFETIGAKLEDYEIKKEEKELRKKKTPAPRVVPQYFDQIETISRSFPVKRICFMMKDLIDLRKNNWQSRREVEKAVKLTDLRANNSAVDIAVSPKTGLGDARKLDTLAPVSAAAANDEWVTVPSKSSSNNTFGGNKSGQNTPLNANANNNSRSFSSSNTSVSPRAANGPAVGGWKSGPQTPQNRTATANNTTNNNTNNNRGGTVLPNNGKGPTILTSNKPTSTLNKAGGNNSRGPTIMSASKPTQSSQSSANNATKQPNNQTTLTVDTHNVSSEAAASVNSSEAATMPPVTADKETQRRIKVVFAEYLTNDLLDECLPALQSLKSVALSEIVRVAIEKAADLPKKTDREKMVKLTHHLLTFWDESGDMRAQSVIETAFLGFLDILDDIIIDMPLAGTHAAHVLGALVASSLSQPVSLQFLHPSNMPADNMFASSPKRADFFGAVLKVVIDQAGLDRAAECYAQTGIPLVAWVLDAKAPRESDASALNSFADKYSIPLNASNNQFFA